ncbi:MAG: hypothetical protein AB1480_03835 [Nitrospirota bacterium]
MQDFIKDTINKINEVYKDMIGLGDWRKRHYFIVKTRNGYHGTFRVCTLDTTPEEAISDIAKNYNNFFYVGTVSNN